MNLLDKTTLARLPQLTSTVSDRGGQVASPIGHSQDIDGSGRNSRSIEIQNDLNVGDLPIKRKKDQTESGKDLSAPVHVDVKEKKANERKAKNENVLKNSGEDLIVLSFSSSGGMCYMCMSLFVSNQVSVVSTCMIIWCNVQVHPYLQKSRYYIHSIDMTCVLLVYFELFF